MCCVSLPFVFFQSHNLQNGREKCNYNIHRIVPRPRSSVWHFWQLLTGNNGRAIWRGYPRTDTKTRPSLRLRERKRERRTSTRCSSYLLRTHAASESKRTQSSQGWTSALFSRVLCAAELGFNFGVVER